MATDRKTLRRRILRRIGDLTIATATAAGTTTTFIDTERLYGEAGRFAGREAYFSGGTAANLGKIRYITGYARTTNTLEFQSALPAATAEGDEIEIANTYGMGVTHEMVHAAINWAIDAARPYAMVPTMVTEADWDGESAISLDASLVMVTAVYYHDTDDVWREIRPAMKLNHNGWGIDRANRELVIYGQEGYRAADADLRIHGYAEPDPLDADDDTTALDVEWLVDKASSHLLLDSVRPRQGGEWDSKGLFYNDRAERLLARLTPNLPPNAVRI